MVRKVMIFIHVPLGIILVCIEKLEKYTQGLTFDQFSKNEMAVDAVIRNFEVIG